MSELYSTKLVLLLSLVAFTLQPFLSSSADTPGKTYDRIFPFQAVDTMKYSRDLAREKVKSASFDQVIEKQVSDIAALGATHIALATPYDSEFLPFLKRWVSAARAHNLKVWFRGNWSGWEGWFNYSKISRAQHIDKTRRFILEHPDLFVDGDVFSSCPECENGGPGDPRQTRDVQGHRKFLIDEYQVMKKAFADIKKDVASNYFSMNGDVARLIMDRETTKALDGIVTIDHYVRTPEQLDADITAIAKQSGGSIVLGEWGAPIPDIHGEQSDADQKAWIDAALKLLVKNKSLYGLSYWLNVGGSTALWDSSGKARSAASVLKEWYSPRTVYGFVRNELGAPITSGVIRTSYGDVSIGTQGYYRIPLSVRGDGNVTVAALGHKVKAFEYGIEDSWVDITLVKEKKGLIYRVQQLLNVINPWRPAYAPTVK